MMNILIIDAQGGGVGRQLVTAIKKEIPGLSLTAVGTNSIATAAMLKAGADQGATGENAFVVCAEKADIIIGPVGIVIANSLLGEITPVMATAVGKSRAKRFLIPINHCDNIVIGIADLNLGKLIQQTVDQLRYFTAGQF